MSNDKGLSPMMKQYMKVKEDLPGTLVMFRLGDFYEFFGEDAEIASKELDIVLTGRNAGIEERMPMCGIPHHAVEQYLARLVQKGYRVAICEQMEDPKKAKGIVKREVVRIVTPGTAMEVAPVKQSANYMAAILRGDNQHWGLAVCEVSTGELKITQFDGPDALDNLSAEMLRIKPCEVLISENDYLGLDDLINKWTLDDQNTMAITLRSAEQFSRDKSLQLLNSQFPEQAKNQPVWLSYPLAGDCAAAILQYLAETQKAVPFHIRRIELDQPNQYLIMDPTTFRNLEITRNLRTFEKKGSLYDLLDNTCTAAGSRMLKEWIERPLTNKEAIEERLDAVEALVNSWSIRQDLRRLLNKVYDLERLMTRVTYKRAVPKELLSLKLSFAVIPEIKEKIKNLPECAELSRIQEDLDDLRDLHQLLDKAIVDDVPLNWKDGGFIKEGYNQQADEYRAAATNGRRWILELESKEKEKTGIKSLKIGFNKVFGYYFEVTKPNLPYVPAYFQRKQTLASGERFVTDDLIHLEGLVLGAEEKMLSLEMSLYDELLEIICQGLPRVQKTSQALARLDIYQSLAEIAVKNQYCRPMILNSAVQDIYFKNLRHPVVEQIMEQHQFVPNDLHLDVATNLLIITGPNMGGKSTYCRSAAVAVIMAQIGSFVSATKARIPIRDRVFARVGASDDLRGGQSTFMMEMKEVAHILKYATENSLVILDEVGRGTGTFDGLSVAWAVSEYLVNPLKTKALFATHYLELTSLADKHAEIQNRTLVVEEKGDDIVFLHKILPGSASKSYGVHVAMLAGLPETVIERSKAILATLEKEKEEDSPVKERHNVVENQLQLFFEDNSIYSPRNNKEQNKQKTDEVKLNNIEKEIIKEIKEKDLANITPLESLNYLYSLQKLLKG